MRRWRWILIAALLSLGLYIFSQTEAMGGLMRFIKSTIARITASVVSYHSPKSKPTLIKLRTSDDITLKGAKSEGGSQGIYTAIIKSREELPSEPQMRREGENLDRLFIQVESLLVEEDQNAYDTYDRVSDSEDSEEEKGGNSRGEDLKGLDELWSQMIGDDFPYPDPSALNDLYYEEGWSANEPMEDLRSMINDEVESELRRIISEMLREEGISNPDQLLRSWIVPGQETAQ